MDFLKDLIIGGSAGVISRTATAPLELYKMQLQSNYLKESTMINVIKREGIRFLWKGNLTNCIRVFPQFSINYGVYNKCRTKHFYYIQDEKIKNFLSGGVAGLVSMTAVYPLETIRTRLALQMQRSHYTTPWNVVKKLTIPELYGGLKISLLGFGPFNALNFMFYNMYQEYFNKYIDNSTTTKLLAGGCSGVSSLSITYPTDLLRRRFQMEGFNKETPKYNGILDGFKTIIKNEGVIGLYRGLGVAYIRIFPCLAIQFWCMETGKSILN